MRRTVSLCFVSLMILSLSALAADQGQDRQGVWQQTQPQSGLPNPNQAIAQGLGGVLTVDAVNAYSEAPEFSLGACPRTG